MSDYSISLSCMYVSLYQTPTYSILAQTHSLTLQNMHNDIQFFNLAQVCLSLIKVLFTWIWAATTYRSTWYSLRFNKTWSSEYI